MEQIPREPLSREMIENTSSYSSLRISGFPIIPSGASTKTIPNLLAAKNSKVPSMTLLWVLISGCILPAACVYGSLKIPRAPVDPFLESVGMPEITVATFLVSLGSLAFLLSKSFKIPRAPSWFTGTTPQESLRSMRFPFFEKA